MRFILRTFASLLTESLHIPFFCDKLKAVRRRVDMPSCKSVYELKVRRKVEAISISATALDF